MFRIYALGYFIYQMPPLVLSWFYHSVILGQTVEFSLSFERRV